jgi:hypothetical protein
VNTEYKDAIVNYVKELPFVNMDEQDTVVDCVEEKDFAVITY